MVGIILDCIVLVKDGSPESIHSDSRVSGGQIWATADDVIFIVLYSERENPYPAFFF